MSDDTVKPDPAFVSIMDQQAAELEVVAKGLGQFYRALCHGGFEPGDAVDLARDWFNNLYVESKMRGAEE